MPVTPVAPVPTFPVNPVAPDGPAKIGWSDDVVGINHVLTLAWSNVTHSPEAKVEMRWSNCACELPWVTAAFKP